MSEHYDYQTKVIQPHVNINGYLVQENSADTYLQNEVVVDNTSIGTVPTSAMFLDNAQITFDIVPSVGDYLDQLFIRMLVTNTSNVVGTTTLVPAPLFIKRVDVFCGTEVVEQVIGEAIWADIITLNDDENMTKIAAVNGFDPETFLSNNLFNDGEAKYFNIPFLSVISGAQVPLRTSNIKWRVTIYFNGGDRLIDDVSPTALITDFELTDCRLWQNMTVLETSVREEKLLSLLAYPHEYRYIEHRYAPLPAGNFSAGNRNSQILTQAGDLSHFYLYARAINPQGQDLYAPLKMRNVDFQNASSQSEFASTPFMLDHDYIQNTYSEHYFPGKGQTQLNIYGLTFNQSPALSMKDQAKYGGKRVTNNIVAVIPDANTSNTELLFLGYYYSSISINFKEGRWLTNHNN